MINGVGPDQATKTDPVTGASQSDIPYRFDLMVPTTMLNVANVLATGADKYGEHNWQDIPIGDHLNHLITHAFAYMAGDRTDDHLTHIICRAMFADWKQNNG